jgi:hypothetical protein
MTGRRSRVARNFLSKFEEKVTSLGRWWCSKESKRCVKNIWRCHWVRFLGQWRELNASDGDTLKDRQDHHEMALAYWRQNHRQYPPAWLWDIFYYDLLFKSFESRYELWDWCKKRLQQLNDPVYYEEQRLKAEEEKWLAREAEKRWGVRHLGLENIKKLYRRRRTDVLERQMMGVRPLRHGHRHDRH